MGDRLRKKRLDLNLFQKDVAKLMGVTTSSVTNWEKNRVGPTLQMIPKIIQFLGYDPLPVGITFGEQIKQYRRKQGLSIKKLAKLLAIDPTTLARWERKQSEPLGKLKEQLRWFLDQIS
ncbi:MAG: helix-turn-helix transcriptional regulator [Ignavibacteriae bacterium]|nr:helix-turn-helix transcriptional regulator [Ignavibacteriota bacterium]